MMLSNQETRMDDLLFDISTFKVQLPGQLDQSYQVDMNGLRFYGGRAWEKSAGSYSFGTSDEPTYVLIGLVDPTFTPMLLVYGVTTLSTNDGGISFFNYVEWTQGLYTVANQLAQGTTPAQVVGGMTIEQMDGGFYTDSLLNSVTDFAISSIKEGKVTTAAPNSFTSGQTLNFSNLVKPRGGVNNGPDYYVDIVFSLTMFTIKALDGSDVSKSSADGGTVASIPRPPAFAISSIAKGTVTTKAPNPFTPGQYLNFRNLVNSKGGVNNGTGYYVDSVLSVARFTIKALNGSDVSKSSADGGTVASIIIPPAFAISRFAEGTVTTKAPNPFTPGQYLNFSNLVNPRGGVNNGSGYYVDSVPSLTEFTILALDGSDVSTSSADGGTVASFPSPQAFAISSFAEGTVTTEAPNSFTPGQNLNFINLVNPNKVNNGTGYYVDSVPSLTEFTILALDGSDVSKSSADGGRVASFPSPQAFGISSFAAGTVTTEAPNLFTPGQNLNFSNLVNPSGGVNNGTGYYVDSVLSLTEFRIRALDGSDVSTSSAGGGTVASFPSPQAFGISSFAEGTVTTEVPNLFTPGQNLNFSNLVNPSGGVNNGTGYYVDSVLSLTEFTIRALDGSDVSTSSADGGTVASIPRPQAFVISSFAKGTVTTEALNSFLPGRNLNFSNLVNPSGGVNNGTGYYVDSVLSLTEFRIKALDGSDVSKSSADGGTVVSIIPSPQDFAISSFAEGTVTTEAPNSFTPGQNLNFSNLVNPSGGVSNGTGYYVDSVLSLTEFRIKALNGSDVSKSSADGGTVASIIPSAQDSSNWGALIPNGQQMPLTSPKELSGNMFRAGFTPSRILLTKTTDAVPQPVLQFSGVQAIEYKRGIINAGLGFQSANNAQYLQIDYLGYFKFVNANNGGDNEIVLTGTLGCPPTFDLITTNGISNGVMTIVEQNPKSPLSNDDWVHFVAVNILPPVPPPVPPATPPLTPAIGDSYQVVVAPNLTFQLKDPLTGGVAFADVNASAATLVKEKSITKIDQQDVVINGQSVNLTVVQTSQPHGLRLGDGIVFKELTLQSGALDQSQTYYVTYIGSDTTSFSFAQVPGGVYNASPAGPPIAGPGGRVTIPLGKMFGFDLGGTGTLTIIVDGLFQGGNWVKPTDWTIGLSGSFSFSYLKEVGTRISGTLSAKGDSETSSGVIFHVQNGNFSIKAGAFNISGAMAIFDSTTKEEKLEMSLSGISGSLIRADDGTDTWSFNGSVEVTIPSLSWNASANFGHGQTNGLTLIVDPQGNHFVQQCSVSIIAQHIDPPTTQSRWFTKNLSVMAFIGDVDYNRDPNNTSDWSLLFGGAITLAIGDPTPVKPGQWPSTVDTIGLDASVGTIELYQGGLKFLPGRIELNVNGPFNIRGKFNVVARSLKFVYQSADPVTQTDEQILLSGGVAFPDLRNAYIQFGNDGASGGLEIDISKGTWKVDGWRVMIPSISAGSMFQLQNFVLGFSKTTDGDGNNEYEIQAGAQVQLLSGKGAGLNIGVYVKFDFETHKLKMTALGASLRNMNPGITIPPTGGGALTDIAFDVDGIPGSVSADILAGMVFGSKVTVGAKEYSMIQVLASGQYKYKDICINGTVLLGGGTLGQVTGMLDFNWGTGVYTVNLTGKFLYESIDASIFLYFSSSLDYGLFSAGLQVPPSIPIIGGISVAAAEGMYYVDKGPGGKKFIAAWVKALGHWKAGFEWDLNAGTFKGIGNSAVNGLEADIPSGVGTKANKYNLAYSPTTPPQEIRQLRGLQDEESSDSYGLFNVVWSNPNGANDTVFIASSNNSAVQVYGPGTSLDSSGWVDDPNGGVSYSVLMDHSGPGNILIHVAPTGAFTAPGASYTNPDLYIPLPNATLNVVLTSDLEQKNPTASWAGSFTVAAPELQNVTVSQLATVSALGDDVSDSSNPDPVTADNATISFQWRGLDLQTTSVSLYYDYNSSGYQGTHIATISGDDLAVSDPDGDGWRTMTVPWDIGDLEPAKPMYIYAVIKDAAHAAVISDYAGQVHTVPAAQIQVSYAGGTQVSSSELEDILLLVTPVQPLSVASITAGVVTVAASTNISAGDMFMFSELASPAGLENTMPYYVIAVNGNTFTFSNVAAGAPINDVTAGQGTAYVDQDAPTIYGTNSSGLVWPQVKVNQAYRFSMAPPRSVFAAAPAAGQEVSNVGELIQYNMFVGNNQLLRMSYQFKVLAAIAGRVFNDFSDNGQLNSMDTGLAGTTVFLDDNNNGVLDPGEAFVITGPDGNFLFIHEWADTDKPTTTYTTWVRVIPPTGLKITASADIPATGITFTNDGNEQAALNYYNFMIAAPVTVGGIVYNDANKDGVRDPGDKGLPGVTVNIKPPSGSAITVTTDSNGRWQTTGYERGSYDISVKMPSGGAFTVATSMSITADAATDLVLQGSTNLPYARTCLASQWDQEAGNYSVWLAALGSETPEALLDFVNLSTNPTGNSSVVNSLRDANYPNLQAVFRLDPFIGKWSAGGTPSLAVTYTYKSSGGGLFTSLAVSPPSPQQYRGEYAAQGAEEPHLYALSWDPSQPDYSTVASIDMNGQVTSWTFNPGRLSGIVFEGGFTAGRQMVKLTRGTPIKMVGFNKGGSDHFQSQDLAVVSSNANGSLSLTEWNHATSATEVYSIGGQVFVDMIAGDFNGNGQEDIAVLTADTNLEKYYLNVLLSQNDGSSELLSHVGSFLAAASDGTPGTNLASVLVLGNQQALLWNTESSNGSTKFIAAALVNGGEVRVSTGAATLAGRIAAIKAGSISTPAAFAVYSMDLSTHNIPVATGTVQVVANGEIAVDPGLTQYGGSFAGFDVGVSGVASPASNVISGIVYNDANSNGIMDPGETGLPGFTVRLIEANNATQTAVTSDGSDGRPVGSYSFENVPSGAYLQVTLPPGTWTAENPPPGVSTNANGSHGIVVGVTFIGGQAVDTIGFTDGSDNPFSVAIKSADLQASGQENLVIRTSSALFVQRFQSDGTSVLDRYDVSSPAAYFRPELYLEDLNADGRIDIVTSGQSGVDVFINIDLGQFCPFTGLLADKLTNSPNGAYAPGLGFTSDLASGITSAKTYTHALNFGGNDIVVNGVTFQAALPTGSNYTLTATDPRNGATGDLAPFPESAVALTGNFATIAKTSYQSPVNLNGTEQLTLTGLTPGLTYTTTFYTVGNNAAPHRIQTVVDNLGGTLTFDANGGQNLNGYMVSRRFVAISNSIVFAFFAQVPSNSFNLIALTNELVTVGRYGSSNLSGDVDSGIVSSKTYTHVLNFAGTAPIAINGVNLTPAGSSGSNWELVSYDSVTNTQSPMQTYNDFKNNLTGNLNSAASNFYFSASPTWQEQLTLSGLTPGVTYMTTFYSAGFYNAGQGQQIVTDNFGGSFTFDQDAGGVGNGSLLTRTYVATSDSITFTFTPTPTTKNSFNQFALTNEVVSMEYSAAITFTDDHDSGIAGGYYYTHALNFAAKAPVTVGAVTFAPAGQSGSNWSLTGYDPRTQARPAMLPITGFDNDLTGEVHSLAANFYYSPVDGEQLTLTGLAVGATYTTTWYGVGYQDGIQRVQYITDSLCGATVIDENLFGSGKGIIFSRTFTAANDTITFTFVPAVAGVTFHQYALTNQLVTSGKYECGRLTGDVDSGISASKTYTHVIDWQATEEVTVNGVRFQQAGRQGADYSLVEIDPHTFEESEIEYFQKWNNNVTGELRSAISNGYISDTGAAKLVLSGLAPGTTYMTTFYAMGVGDPGERLQTISDSQGGVYHFDENMFGNLNGFRLTRTYTATSDSIKFYIVGDNLKSPFLQGALTNEVVPPSHQSPNVYGTDVAVVPSTGDTPAKIYAAQQNTQTVYELAWDTATATLAPTGRFFPLDRLVTRLLAGSVVNVGELDLVVYENSNNGPANPFINPADTSYQKLWIYTPGDLYTRGTELIDFGFHTYQAEVDLLLAPLFPGVQTVVFMGEHITDAATHVVTYRAGSGTNRTTLPGGGWLSLGVGQFVPGSRTPDILVAGTNSIAVLESGTDPKDVNDPDGPDPSVPLVVRGITYTPYSWNAAAVGGSIMTHSDDLMVVRYDQNAGFIVLPYFNITGGYEISENAGGGLYDFPVVVPGSNGGTINGNVFYDVTGNGKWDPTDHGVYDEITVYLDLNNNGQMDPTDPRTFPNRDGDFQFAQLPPKAYTVGIQLGKGYILTTAASVGVTIPAVPGAKVNGVDFGVKTKDFGADFNNDHQPDLLLSDPKDQSIYVQLRNGSKRLGTYKIGTLPSADWLVAGVSDLSGNGTADVLIHNVRTGELRVWDFFPGRGTPTVARTTTLDYVVPTGYTLLGVADLDANGQPELILGDKLNGDYRAVELKGLNTSSERKLSVPAGTSIVGAGDIDWDGNADLLLRDRKTGHLLIYLFDQGKPTKLVNVGKPKDDWLVAGITGLLQGDQQEILFQEKSTGKAFAWKLDANLNIASVIDLDIGTHDGLRVHLAER
jgi:hypothetical protein